MDLEFIVALDRRRSGLQLDVITNNLSLKVQKLPCQTLKEQSCKDEFETIIQELQKFSRTLQLSTTNEAHECSS